MNYAIIRSDGYLAHHGVKGQKKGERRYQNEDGSLTPEGREHYGIGQGNKYRNADGSLTKKGAKEVGKFDKWYNSTSGRIAMNRTRRSGSVSGLSASDMYGMHKTKRAALIGTILAGPVAGITAGLVTQSRYNKEGRDFIDSVLSKRG